MVLKDGILLWYFTPIINVDVSTEPSWYLLLIQLSLRKVSSKFFVQNWVTHLPDKALFCKIIFSPLRARHFKPFFCMGPKWFLADSLGKWRFIRCEARWNCKVVWLSEWVSDNAICMKDSTLCLKWDSKKRLCKMKTRLRTDTLFRNQYAFIAYRVFR